MLSEPKFITRGEQPYAAIRLTLKQSEIPQKAPPLNDEVMGWLKAQAAAPTGAPFFNYTRMGPGEEMEMEVGWPTATVLKADGKMVTGTLPAGRYASVRYTGPYDGLYGAHSQLHEWLGKQGMVPRNWGGADTGRSTLLEIYETDPAEVPDPQQWITDIAFRLPD
jgi:effector-binding domain-containing protein